MTTHDKNRLYREYLVPYTILRPMEIRSILQHSRRRFATPGTKYAYPKTLLTARVTLSACVYRRSSGGEYYPPPPPPRKRPVRTCPPSVGATVAARDGIRFRRSWG